MNKPKDVFDIKIGMRVYDTFTNHYGRISDVRETAVEWIEAFVKWDGEDKEQPLNMYSPNIKFVNE